MNKPNDEILTVEELAELLKTSKVNIYKMVKNNEIPYFTLGNMFRFTKSDVLEALKAKAVKKTA
jgi:excisionase family DNA binding protein